MLRRGNIICSLAFLALSGAFNAALAAPMDQPLPAPVRLQAVFADDKRISDYFNKSAVYTVDGGPRSPNRAKCTDKQTVLHLPALPPPDLTTIPRPQGDTGPLPVGPPSKDEDIITGAIGKFWGTQFYPDAKTGDLWIDSLVLDVNNFSLVLVNSTSNKART